MNDSLMRLVVARVASLSPFKISSKKSIMGMFTEQLIMSAFLLLSITQYGYDD